MGLPALLRFALINSQCLAAPAIPDRYKGILKKVICFVYQVLYLKNHFFWQALSIAEKSVFILKAVTLSKKFQRMYGNFIADMLYLHFAGGALGQHVLSRVFFQGIF
jgi:hypothetical protein